MKEYPIVGRVDLQATADDFFKCFKKETLKEK